MNYSFSDKVFGSLPKQYCLWFYVFCILSFILVISSLIGFFILFTQKNVPFVNYVYAIALCISYLFNYITYRLLYSMCISSLK